VIFTFFLSIEVVIDHCFDRFKKGKQQQETKKAWQHNGNSYHA